MSVLVCGSLAYDTLLTFQDSFKNHILPDQLHKLSVCFMVPQLRREFGGCAGNIGYNLRLLGGTPLIMSSVGEDFGPYRAHLQGHGLVTDHILEVPGYFTAQCFITSDRDANQITAFHPGASECATRNHVRDVAGVRLAIVAPSGYEADLQQSRELAEAGIPFIFDPGQELPLFSRDELFEMIGLARWLTLNDYEAELMRERTGLSVAQLAERVEALVITRGGLGSEIFVDGDVIRIPAVRPAAVVDPTGCGDAYRAGLLYGLAEGWDWEACGRTASMLGAIKIASRGAQNHHFDRAQLAALHEDAFGQPWPGV